MLYVSENVRIKRNDAHNFTVDVYRNVTNRKTKEVTGRWVLEGYYGTIRQALHYIDRKGLLIDEQAATTLTGYIEQMEESHELLYEAIENIK